MLLIARHGQCAQNAAGLLVGRSDPPLTDLGQRQAAALGRAVASAIGSPSSGSDPGRERAAVQVVASPLGRARATAAAICDALGIASGAITVDARWVEIDYGAYEGMPAGSVAQEVWTSWRKDLAFRPPGGESLADVAERVREACDEIASTASRSASQGDAGHPTHTIVVSHVSPIKAAVAWALGADAAVVWRMHLDVASLSRVALPQDTVGGVAVRRRPALRSYNEIAHLAALP